MCLTELIQAEFLNRKNTMTSSATSDTINLYSPLPTRSSIRLIEVHPIRESENVLLSCTVQVECLKDSDLDFHALSYTWGDPFFRYWWDETSSESWTQDVPILCNGIKVKITHNLMSALKTISQRYRGSQNQNPRLWVDSLSINQYDVQERNSQVNMMAQIYGKASLVISWLGPADEDSELAIPLMHRLMAAQYVQDMIEDYSATPQYSITLSRRHRQTSDSAPEVEDDSAIEGLINAGMKDIAAISSRHYESLARFLARRYFFRCWVLQELMLARKLCMLCGTQEIQLSDLHKVAVFVSSVRKHRPDGAIGQALSLPMNGPRGFEHERAIVELWQYKQQLKTALPSGSAQTLLTFEHLLALARVSGCRDPRDKIYSLLGLLPQATFKLEPDYSKPVDVVYSYAVRYWINETRTLNCLSWVANEADRRFPEIPTWIGEFENTVNQQELAFTAIVHDATLGSKIANSVPLEPNGPQVLQARGVRVDHIAELAHTRERRGFGIDCHLWASMTLKIPRIYPFTGQARGEVLFQTLLANEINNAPFSEKRDSEEFQATVRRDTGFAIIRELHRMRWYSTASDDLKSYDALAFKLLQNINTLAATDDSHFITSWDEIRSLEARTCTCDAGLSHLERLQHGDLPSPDPDCFYVKDTVRRLNGLYPHSESAKPDFVSSPTNVPDAQGWEHSFRMALDHKLYSRRLARTEKGYLALAPAGSEVGDAVWLLQGARVPFIMRRTYNHKVWEGRVTTDPQDHWKIVGDAYVHGMMQGEIWKTVIEEQLEDIDLV